ncbi:hypothetical protein FBU30_003057 [Linnemannia zychae]|nr:hypothetical protein FBU30_003057 [Linnemannia zychae]
MAPIPRLAAGPVSIITTALFNALSGPNSAPPTNGTAAVVKGANYTGMASYFNLSPDSIPSSPVSSPKSPSPNATVSPSLVYYNSTSNSYTGCDKKPFYLTDNVAFVNPLQFGDVTSTNSTCGQWIQVYNRINTDESIYAKVVGVCDDCEYGSLALNRDSLQGLAYDTPFELMVFDENSEVTIDSLTDPVNPLPPTTPISPKDLLNIVWTLSSPPPKPDPTTPTPTSTIVKSSSTPTTTTTTTTTKTTTTKTTTTKKPTPKPTSDPSPGNGGNWYTGRATWYSDTHGQCEHNYSQSDMIVAVNEAQMGNGKNLCGKKILVTDKGSNTQVVVTVVDMCPSKYCNFGDLDLSQGAFKKFAGLGVGVLKLTWTFL